MPIASNNLSNDGLLYCIKSIYRELDLIDIRLSVLPNCSEKKEVSKSLKHARKKLRKMERVIRDD